MLSTSGAQRHQEQYRVRLQHRREARLSQEALAERAGLSRRDLADLERGVSQTPRPATLRRIFEGLGLDSTETGEWTRTVRAESIQKEATVAELLRSFRVNARLTQRGLAERAGLSVRPISDLERGIRHIPHPDTVGRLADALYLSDQERRRCRSSRVPDAPAFSATTSLVSSGVPNHVRYFAAGFDPNQPAVAWARPCALGPRLSFRQPSLNFGSCMKRALRATKRGLDPNSAQMIIAA